MKMIALVKVNSELFVVYVEHSAEETGYLSQAEGSTSSHYNHGNTPKEAFQNVLNTLGTERSILSVVIC